MPPHCLACSVSTTMNMDAARWSQPFELLGQESNDATEVVCSTQEVIASAKPSLHEGNDMCSLPQAPRVLSVSTKRLTLINPVTRQRLAFAENQGLRIVPVAGSDSLIVAGPTSAQLVAKPDFVRVPARARLCAC